MQEMYDLIMKHKRIMADMQLMWEKAIKDHQHEYDSDEEVDEDAGTWEHRLRKMEMEKTRGMADCQSGKWCFCINIAWGGRAQWVEQPSSNSSRKVAGSILL